MHTHRRSAGRQKSETLAYLQFPTGIVPALVLEITEQGLSLQAAEGLTPLRGVPLRFLLPGTSQVIQATGDFIWADGDRKSTRLNSSHIGISYAVFCLKKKKQK